MTENDITPYFLSAEERATWTERLKKARKGLFNPPSTDETVAVPGAVGGANWGNTAANPAAGLVYVMSQDFPSFYKLTTDPSGGMAGAGRGGRSGGGPAAGAQHRRPMRRAGRLAYEQTCQSCHGGDHAGVAGAGAPSIAGVGARMAYQDFRQVILAGRGRMPAFANVDEPTMTALFSFLGGRLGTDGRGAGPADKPPSGPVVASGGAPGGLDLPAGGGGRGSNAYPAGVDAPAVRYYTGYGLGNPHIMTGPWSRLVAYDLNAGTIKWQVPLGVDRMAAEQGGADAGVPRGSQRMGMIVTSTGLLFATAKDGKVRAYSADDGKILWSADLPHGTEGLPAMYEVGGRQYLVVCATTGLTWGPKSREGGAWTQGDVGSGAKGGYVAFALPGPGREIEPTRTRHARSQTVYEDARARPCRRGAASHRRRANAASKEATVAGPHRHHLGLQPRRRREGDRRYRLARFSGLRIVRQRPRGVGKQGRARQAADRGEAAAALGLLPGESHGPDAAQGRSRQDGALGAADQEMRRQRLGRRSQQRQASGVSSSPTTRRTSSPRSTRSARRSTASASSPRCISTRARASRPATRPTP